jgi:2-succinyl-5-enolpyruvyl-6-hydroxy-3-cyclohexene-1-carboxylate synthase|tara:strand:+ start:5210 stop:6898 length:1689 start_codon:yes stop_codon:yes gene_type:complete
LIIQSILELVAICAKKGVKNVILSPGSRCAPLTLAFARHPEIHTRTISDERSAAFIALGMAQQLNQPVALVCTSGSAALNYYPAIAEAFFQQIPLLVLTADRPPEWIDQWDGQTIFQQEVYGKHIKKSFQFPDTFGDKEQSWYAARMVNEAINTANHFPKGPVHINIPLREPFYPSENESFDFPEHPYQTEISKGTLHLGEESLKKINSKLQSIRKILIVPGQQKPDEKIVELLKSLSKNKRVVVITDTISNLQSEESINFHDHWMGNQEVTKGLEPDLILSFGKSIISKSLKLFLRNSKAEHWHIQENAEAKDTYQSLSKILACSPMFFLNWLNSNLPIQDETYYNSWWELEKSILNNLNDILEQSQFGEYKALHQVLKNIPDLSKIHVANSMAVRYLNFLGRRKQEIICNRGTSGIDGSSSTAVGCTFTTKLPVTLITGDLAFFYDRNAFWHNYSMANLRIILLNNHAGGIFRLIEGPAKQPELQEYFETKQKLNAKCLANEFGFTYFSAKNEVELDSALKDFYDSGVHPKILEIESQSPLNAEILKSIKEKVKTILPSA